MAEELISRMRRSCEGEFFSAGLPSSCSFRCATSSECSRDSVIASTAPESSTIHCTWDSEEDG